MMTMSRKDTDPIVSYILCLAMILSIFGSFFAPVEVFAATPVQLDAVYMDVPQSATFNQLVSGSTLPVLPTNYTAEVQGGSPDEWSPSTVEETDRPASLEWVYVPNSSVAAFLSGDNTCIVEPQSDHTVDATVNTYLLKATISTTNTYKLTDVDLDDYEELQEASRFFVKDGTALYIPFRANFGEGEIEIIVSAPVADNPGEIENILDLEDYIETSANTFTFELADFWVKELDDSADLNQYNDLVGTTIGTITKSAAELGTSYSAMSSVPAEDGKNYLVLWAMPKDGVSEEEYVIWGIHAFKFERVLTKIDPINIDIDWVKLPEVTTGEYICGPEDDAALNPADVSANGVATVSSIWMVKFTPEHASLKQNNIPADVLLVADTTRYNGWVPVSKLADLGYEINAEDKYGILVKTFAEDGYYFATQSGNDLYAGSVTSHDNSIRNARIVSKAQPEYAEHVFALGTAGEIEAKKDFILNVDTVAEIDFDFNGDVDDRWNGKADLTITTPARITFVTDSCILEGTLTIATNAVIETSSGACTVAVASTNGALVITDAAAHVFIYEVDFVTENLDAKGVVVIENDATVYITSDVAFDNKAVDIYFEDDVNVNFENDMPGKAVIKYGGEALTTGEAVNFSVTGMDEDLLYYFELVDEPYTLKDDNYEVMYSSQGQFYITPHKHEWNVATTRVEGTLRIECKDEDCKYNINPINMTIDAATGRCGEPYNNYTIDISGDLAASELMALKKLVEIDFYDVSPFVERDSAPSTEGAYKISIMINTIKAFADFTIEHNTINTSHAGASGHWYVCSIDGTSSSALTGHALTYVHTNEQHWEKCTVCGYETEKENHGLVKVTQSGINSGHFEYCGECGYQSGEHTHRHEIQIAQDGHWYKCSDCQFTTEKKPHDYSVYDYDNIGEEHWMKCNVCGREKEDTRASHGALTIKISTSEHAFWCEECSYTTGTALHQSNGILTNGGFETHWYNCSEPACNIKMHEAPHVYEYLKNNATEHWYECTCGAVSGTAIHGFTEHEWSTEGGIYQHWDKCDLTGCGITTAAVGVVLEVGYDDDEHWYECSVENCTYIESVDAHTTEVGFSTDKHWVYCTDNCGYKTPETDHVLMLDKSDAGHWKLCTSAGCTYRTDVTPHAFYEHGHDESHHWLQCNYEDCDWIDQTSVEEHVAGDYVNGDAVYPGISGHHWNKCTDSACVAAGVKVNITAHNHTMRKHDNYNHWTECVCGHKDNETRHDLEYVIEGEQHYQKCNDCEYKTSKYPHDYDCFWNDEVHWYVCGDCNTSVAAVAHDSFLVTETDEYSHWKECTATDCGFTVDAVSHSALRQWNESKHWDLCTPCGVTYGATGHNIVLTTDAGCHWESCEDCGYETSHVTHSAVILISTDAAYHWHVCETCGTATDPVAHNHNVLQKDDAQHWYKCFACLHETERVDHTSTYAIQMTADNHWYECTVCGDTTTPEAHDFKATGFNSEVHWDECQNEGKR